MTTHPTRTLSEFLVASRYEDIPAEVRHEASRAMLNALGCAIGSARHETVEAALTAVTPFAGAPQAAILGRTERLDALNAALVNGISIHVLDFDDTHQRAVHPSAPVLPALLAYAEWKQTSGRDLVHAFVLGVEAEVRIGLSVFPEHYDIGWHITGTAGVFGAAAATAKLLGLDPQRTAWALGIAATQSSGLREMFGSMCKSLHPGRAAQGGMTAALLAAQGFTSSERAIEAPRGFANVMSTKFDPTVITAGLGEHYELSKNMYKPYACGLVVHAAIDGCIQLRREHGLEPDDIASVELATSLLVPELTGNRTPQNGLEGKFSIYHAAAVALVHGAAGEAQFSDAVVRDATVIGVRDRVSIEASARVRKLEAHVKLRLRNGTVLEKHVEHALGTVERPMSDRDLEDKFRSLADGVLSAAEASRVIGLCWRVAELEDAGELARATVPR
ncbi:MAG: 2-methylcitrate dehydratase [Betaproteobacteria bacterium]|nr:2-methylcitrate dehydratase [Betaproteobacteria bacterium]